MSVEDDTSKAGHRICYLDSRDCSGIRVEVVEAVRMTSAIFSARSAPNVKISLCKSRLLRDLRRLRGLTKADRGSGLDIWIEKAGLRAQWTFGRRGLSARIPLLGCL